jgi:hypothetical protein
MMQGVGGAALAQSLAVAEAAPAARPWPIQEGPDTPKLCLAPGDGGGPLPASLQPAPPRAAAGRGGGYGGFLAPSAEAAPAPSAAFQRIRQLGVTHLLGVGVGGSPWTEENVRHAVQTAKDAGLVAYNAMINVPASVIYGRDTRHRSRRQGRADGRGV